MFYYYASAHISIGERIAHICTNRFLCSENMSRRLRKRETSFMLLAWHGNCAKTASAYICVWVSTTVTIFAKWINVNNYHYRSSREYHNNNNNKTFALLAMCEIHDLSQQIHRNETLLKKKERKIVKNLQL